MRRLVRGGFWKPRRTPDSDQPSRPDLYIPHPHFLRYHLGPGRCRISPAPSAAPATKSGYLNPSLTCFLCVFVGKKRLSVYPPALQVGLEVRQGQQAATTMPGTPLRFATLGNQHVTLSLPGRQVLS